MPARPHTHHADEAVLTGRWCASRKEAVLSAIRTGELTQADACARYGISPGELVEWMEKFRVGGRDGLAVTKEVGRG